MVNSLINEIWVLDFETSLMSKDSVVPRPICLSYFNGADKGILTGDEMSPFLFKLFNSEALIVAHNITFELMVISHHYPNLIPLIHKKLEKGQLYCTLVYEKLIDLVREKQLYKKKPPSLSNVVLNYFGEDISESKSDPNSWRLRYSELEGIPLEDWPKEAVEYSLQDAVYPYRVYQVQKKNPKLEYKLHIQAMYVLNYMGRQGVDIDPEKVLDLEKEILDKLNPAYTRLIRKGLLEHRPEKYKLNNEEIKNYLLKKNVKSITYTKNGVSISKANVLKYLNEFKDEVLNDLYKYITEKKTSQRLLDEEILSYEEAGIKENQKVILEYIKDLKLKRYNYTKSGLISTNKDSLNVYYTETADQCILDLIEHSTYKVILSNFISKLKEASPKTYSEYTTPIDTGRTSCHGSSLYPSVNLQNQPRDVEGTTGDIRGCFVPPKGYLIASIDYKFLELASTASQLLKYYGQSKMADKVNYGEEPADLHSVYAATVMSADLKRQVSYEEFIHNIKDPLYKGYRKKCKQCNLSFPGGIGYDKLGVMLRTQGVNPYFKILATHKYENKLLYSLRKFKENGNQRVRIARLSKWEYALVEDEIVEMKNRYLNLYPELREFLREDHENFFMYKDGKPYTIKVKNEFGEWEDEQMYQFQTHDLQRKYCMYTQICNGFLMQIPGAKGAKMAMYDILTKYQHSGIIKPIAFIHDEFVFAYKIGCEDVIEEIAEIMCYQQHLNLPGVKISVEADYGMKYWMKELGEKTFTMWITSDGKLQIKR